MSNLSPTTSPETSRATTAQNRSLLWFFLLILALSIPIWLIGGLTGLQLMEGLPISSLMTFCPLAAALILTYRDEKRPGMKQLLGRIFDYRRIEARVWYGPALLLMPAIALLAYWLMRLFGLPLPSPEIPILTGLLLFFVFFIAAIGEEIGWTGYALDRIQARWTALQAGILLGVVGALWHVIPFLQAGRSVTWILWQCLFLVASRVIVVWLYNNAGKSLFAVILFHVTINLISFLFPNYGSHYDPRIIGPLTTLAAVFVTFVWGPQTLAGSKDD